MINKAAIFDVDGTLSRGFYIVKFPETLCEEGLFSQEELTAIREIFAKYTKDTSYPYEQFAWDLVNSFGRGIRGKSQTDVERLGKRYVELHADEKVAYTDGIVGLVKARGYRTVVISGSPYEIILPFSRSLGIEDTFATTYKAERGVFTGEVIQNCAINGTKRLVIERYFQEQGIDAKSSVGFGDSHHDLAFLDLVGYPVALNPNARLEEIAKERKWLICHENDQVFESVKSYLP